ncbi:Hypothetical_protein [Hexamita inflata]|uniref:Hypothetical_protein n=1 Tax=Hexamita inflata TaxID=28002 RepID=A0AA86QV64_9EUKA|nr:Hypothetical protein HINF_LOCUS26440 [Hexamita inflata]CAI9964763.1 Hypothetical protein HINF_LOCUS52408 [Hexamita inflata]
MITTSVDISKQFTNPYNISVYNPLSQLYESATQEHDCFVLDSERISHCMYVIYNFVRKIYEQVLFIDGWQNSTTLIESDVSSCESVSVREDSLIINKYDYIRLATNKKFIIEPAVTTTENKTVFISNIKKKNLVIKNNAKKNTFDLVQISNGNLFLLKENVQKKRNFYFQIVFENGVKRKYIQTLNGRIRALQRCRNWSGGLLFNIYNIHRIPKLTRYFIIFLFINFNQTIPLQVVDKRRKLNQQMSLLTLCCQNCRENNQTTCKMNRKNLILLLSVALCYQPL